MLKFLKKNNDEQAGSTKEGKAATGNCRNFLIYFLKFTNKICLVHYYSDNTT